MGYGLVEKAEWVGGRLTPRLPAWPRLVLMHMARVARDNEGKGVGDDRYAKAKDGKPAQLFTQSKAEALDDLGNISARQYAAHISELKRRGLVEVARGAAPGRSIAYRLHVAETYDALIALEEPDAA